MKKRLYLVLILAAAMMLLASCSGNDGQQSTQAGGAAKNTDKIPVILDQMEYALSQNIFANDEGGNYLGKTMTKRGVLGKIEDSFSDMTRYYVWGYMDNTRCCDWQWEFVPEDPASLPPVGSLVQVKGTFRTNNKALDKYWLTDTTVTVEEKYTGAQADLNMLAMSNTLERVQVANIVAHPDPYEGKSYFAYGKISGLTELADPYYDNSWRIEYAYEKESPAIGTYVILRGNVKSGILGTDSLEISND